MYRDKPDVPNVGFCGMITKRHCPKTRWVTDNRLCRPGTAVQPVKARLTLGDIDETVAVTATDKAAVFEVSLEAGPTKLQTWFIDADGTERGAYFCCVERL